MSYFYFCLWNM